jgi:hemolysin III
VINPSVPRFRGLLHVWGAAATIPMAICLMALAGTGVARVGVAVYIAGIAAMFGTSAVYHRGPWRPAVKRVFQRLDHSTIFLAIAGTYTPLALLALHGAMRVALLLLVWVGAALGITLQWLPLRQSRVMSAVVYAMVGWAAVIALPQLVHGMGWLSFALVLVGGVAYTVGSVVYATKRPNWWPATFGFHEVFHACTLVAAAAHFTAVALVVARKS